MPPQVACSQPETCPGWGSGQPSLSIHAGQLSTDCCSPCPDGRSERGRGLPKVTKPAGSRVRTGTQACCPSAQPWPSAETGPQGVGRPQHTHIHLPSPWNSAEADDSPTAPRCVAVLPPGQAVLFRLSPEPICLVTFHPPPPAVHGGGGSWWERGQRSMPAVLSRHGVGGPASTPLRGLPRCSWWTVNIHHAQCLALGGRWSMERRHCGVWWERGQPTGG